MQDIFSNKEKIDLLRKIAAKPFYDARTDFEMALIEDSLVKEGYVKILSRYVIPEYFTCEITPLGRTIVKKGKYVEMEQAINIFISHSSKDTDLVIKFLRLLRSAFLIPSEEIRCTSVDGFKLPIGTKTSEKLKYEVVDSKLFIGIITKNSLASLYTCFELGARWATGNPFLPIICDKDGVGLLKAPLTEINAAVANDRNSVLQLLSQIGEELNIKQENITVFNNDLDEFVDYVNNKQQSNTCNDFETKVDDYMKKHTIEKEDIDKMCEDILGK